METLNWAYILAGVGLGLMIGLSGAGSAIGLVISGSSAIGGLKKRPEAFGTLLVASVLPSTQGIYGFVGFFLYLGKVNENISLFSASLVFGAGIMLGLAALISAIFQGKVCASSASAIGSGHNTLVPGLVMGAMPEFYAILALVASIILLGSV
ncbi:MAG: ATPase [Spirochaetes bacterium]|nr:ATPase [Spirochaetota bacterium]